MPILKSFLEEELKNSIRMKKSYENELAHLLKGALVLKKIKGHSYYYLAFREHDKVRYIYKGRASANEIKKFKEAKSKKAQLRPLLARVKQQIKFLNRVLNDRQLQSMP